VVARTLDASCAYQRGGRFYFPLSDRWALAISPDDAGRFRIGAFYGSAEVATMWSRSEDWHRLADLVLALRTEIGALSA
jgi:hypothetical protein